MKTWDRVISHITGEGAIAPFFVRQWLRRLVLNEPEKFPYLRLYGPKRSGKSAFCRAVGLLATSIEYNFRSEFFNEELTEARVAILDGVKLDQIRVRRMEQWVGTQTIRIDRQAKMPMTIVNSIRWIECCNEFHNVPWTIVPFYCEPVVDPMDRGQLFERLREELPAFREELIR